MPVQEPSPLDGVLGLDLHSVPGVLQEVASDGVSGPEKVAVLRPKLVHLLGNQLPKTLEIQFVQARLLEAELVS